MISRITMILLTLIWIFSISEKVSKQFDFKKLQKTQSGKYFYPLFLQKTERLEQQKLKN